MNNQRYLIFLLALILFSCSQKKEESNSHKNSSINDSIIKQIFSAKPNPIPLPEADSVFDTKPCIYLFKNKDEFFLFDSIGLDTFRLTSNPQRIGVGLQSPTGKYIACLVQVLLVESPGEWGDKVAPLRPLYDLVIVNSVSSKIIRRMDLPSGDDMNLDKWVSKSRLLFHTAAEYAVESFYVYDAFRDSLQKVPEEYGEK